MNSFLKMCRVLGVTPTFPTEVLNNGLSERMLSKRTEFTQFMLAVSGYDVDTLVKLQQESTATFDEYNPSSSLLYVTAYHVLAHTYLACLEGIISPPIKDFRTVFDGMFLNYRTGRIPKGVLNNVDNLLTMVYNTANNIPDPMEGIILD